MRPDPAAPRLSALRPACGEVAARATHVTVLAGRLDAYGAELAAEPPRTGDPLDASPHDPEAAAAFWLTLDAVNFGSGWFPTLRKAPGSTGYRTISGGIRRRFAAAGPWPAVALCEIDSPELAGWLGQAPDHPLMALQAEALRDLGQRVAADHAGHFLALARCTGGSAPALAEHLGGRPGFADSARYDELELSFLKRAQIAAADLHRAGVIPAPDLAGLTMFADNLVPHVLRLDGVLRFDLPLVDRIERGALLEPGSREEVEIRACALHAVEGLVARLPGVTAAELDGRLWQRGQGARYKASPRHRCRTTAY